jgi:hypothetical protein
MAQPLNPDDMQSLLTHDRRYQRAAAIFTTSGNASRRKKTSLIASRSRSTIYGLPRRY